MPEIQSKDRRLSTIETAIRAEESRFAEILPKFMQGQRDRFLQLAVEMATKPDLANCSPVSIVAGVMKAAQCGLPLDGTHAALTPFKGSATFVPMYQGLIAAATRNGGTQAIWSSVVYEGDDFTEILGSEPKLTHIPRRGNRTIDKALCAYACAKLPSGVVLFEVMDRDQILVIKAASKAQKGPWSDKHAEPEMWRKTVVRRLAKYLVKSPEFQAVLDADEEFEPRDVEATDVGGSTMPPAGARNLADLVPPKTQPRTVDVQAKSEAPLPAEKWYGNISIALTRPAADWIDVVLKAKGDRPGAFDGLSLRQIAASTDPRIAAERKSLIDIGEAQQDRTGIVPEFVQKLAEACRLHALAETAQEGEYSTEGN